MGTLQKPIKHKSFVYSPNFDDLLSYHSEVWNTLPSRESDESKQKRDDLSLVLEVLFEIQEDQKKHVLESATKAGLVQHDTEIKTMLAKQQEELALKIETANAIIEKYSGKRLLLFFSLLSVLISGFLLISNVIHGKIIITTPIPEVIFLASFLFLLLSLLMPKSSK